MQVNLSNNPETNKLIAMVDALLPQTQCGLCDHAGCLPYAGAMVTANEPINKCVPAGQAGVEALAKLLNRNILKPAESKFPTNPETNRPISVKAVIREDECIGCTKCITACPVDAIIGAGKMMHTIVPDLCTGCELCLHPCPVDCIDIIQVPEPTETERLAIQDYLRKRFNARIKREHIQSYQPSLYRKPVVAVQSVSQLAVSQLMPKEAPIEQPTQSLVNNADAVIEGAKLRTQLKKLQKRMSVSSPEQPIYADLAQQIAEIEQQLQQLS